MIENQSATKGDMVPTMEFEFAVSTEGDLIKIMNAFGLFQIVERKSPEVSKLHYFKNNDGSIRWVWPAKAKQAYFLDLYSQGSFKSKLFGFVAKYVFLVGLGRFFKHGSIQINTQQNGSLISLDWALFTGTVGPNRKAILRLGKNELVEYHKIPFSIVAEQNLSNEANALKFLKESNASYYFDFPQNIETDSLKTFKQKSLIGRDLHTESNPLNLDLRSLIEWNSKNIVSTKPTSIDVDFNDKLFNPNLINNLSILSNWCASNPIQVSVPQHGDFTPWNCRMSGNRLQILDWEMFKPKGIPLEDLFHFIYQQGILVERINLVELRTRIDEMLMNDVISEFLISNKLSPLQLELHYLNNNIRYYLNVYSKQEKLHTQVEWLMNTWNDSLAFLLKVVDNSVRSSVLVDFQNAISRLKYAVLKFDEDTLSQIPSQSDIDICSTKNDAIDIIQFFHNHKWIRSVRVNNLGKMIQLEARLLDNSRIDIDLIFKFRRKNIDYLNAENVLKTRVQNTSGLWLASKESNADYVLNFYTLNNSEIPEKHRVWVSQPNKSQVEDIKNAIGKRNENRGFNAIVNRISYAIEIIKSMGMKQGGFLITFSGVDGAGKSTIIETVKLNLEKKYRRRVIVLRHRPSILPIISALKYGKKNAEQKSASTLPRQGTNSSKLSSLLRFSYYLFDYVFGQWWIYFRHVRKNTIVLYDRYYFDFINDSRRSNISLNPKFTEKFYSLLKKPEFNFFLWASPEVILKRKQELDEETIRTLTQQYSDLFARLQSSDSDHVYRCIENVEIEETLIIMMRIIGKKLHEADFYPINTIEKP